MKNIKPITLAALFILSASIYTHAQTQPGKQPVRPIPQVSPPPVTPPEMSNTQKPVTAAVPDAQTPSPLTRDKNQPPPEKEKPVLKAVNDKEPSIPGGEEGRKIMAGKTTRPTPEIINHSTADPKAQPVPAAKPAVSKQQLNQ